MLDFYSSHLLWSDLIRSNCDIYIDSSSIVSSIISTFGITRSEIQNEGNAKKKYLSLLEGYFKCLCLLTIPKPHGIPVTEKGENIAM